MVISKWKKWKKRYRKWKVWREFTWFGPIKQYLILFGFIKSDYFNNFVVLEEN